LDQGIPALVQAYGQRFRNILPHPSDYPDEKKESLEAFSKAVTSNLVGGVGYFYGTSIVDRKFAYEWDEDEEAVNDDTAKGPRLTEPRALLTATPSRSFFPRGFYWWVKATWLRYSSNLHLGTRAFTFCTLLNGTTTLGTSFIFTIQFNLSHHPD
jgi:Glycosyl hydrolase family 63 C-terminal domain